MSSPYSLHPNSAFAAPRPPPPGVTMPMRMTSMMPPPPPPPPMLRPPPMDPRTVRPIEIVPRVQVIPHTISLPKDIPHPRAGTPYPIVREVLREPKEGKALPKQAPAVLTTINEGPLKLRLKKRESPKTDPTWEVLNGPAKRKAEGLKAPPPSPASPDGTLVIDIPDPEPPKMGKQ